MKRPPHIKSLVRDAEHGFLIEGTLLTLDNTSSDERFTSEALDALMAQLRERYQSPEHPARLCAQHIQVSKSGDAIQINMEVHMPDSVGEMQQSFHVGLRSYPDGAQTILTPQGESAPL